MKKQGFGSLSLAGVLSALALVFLLITTTNLATVGTVALAAVCGIPVVVELGRRAGWLHFASVAILAWLIVPSLEGKMLYTVFFGWYTVAKAWLEAKGLPRAVEWGVKIALFVVVLGVAAAAWYFLVAASMEGGFSWWILPVGAVVSLAILVLYDRCITGLVGVYQTRLQSVLRRAFRL